MKVALRGMDVVKNSWTASISINENQYRALTAVLAVRLIFWAAITGTILYFSNEIGLRLMLDGWDYSVPPQVFGWLVAIYPICMALLNFLYGIKISVWRLHDFNLIAKWLIIGYVIAVGVFLPEGKAVSVQDSLAIGLTAAPYFCFFFVPSQVEERKFKLVSDGEIEGFSIWKWLGYAIAVIYFALTLLEMLGK